MQLPADPTVTIEQLIDTSRLSDASDTIALMWSQAGSRSAHATLQRADARKAKETRLLTNARPARGVAGEWDLDPLAVRDRFQLLAFLRRDECLEYLWTLRAMDLLRSQHVNQPDHDKIAQALAVISAEHRDAPRHIGKLRERLDTLAVDDHILHRLDDPGRAGSLARYRNRQSVYQFSEIGYFAFTAVESVLGARVQDATLSRLAFSDILRDLRELVSANESGNGDEIVRRLTSLERAVQDMANRSTRFHMTLGEMMRQSDSDPESFLRYKNALLTHMHEFMLELDRYMPQLSEALTEVESTGLETMLARAGESDDRPLLRPLERMDDWRRRWFVIRAWFAIDEFGSASQTEQLRGVTRSAVSGLIALLRQITEARRGGVNRSTELRHLAKWVWQAPDQATAIAIASTAFNLRSVRHLGGAYEDPELIDANSSWWKSVGVDVSGMVFRKAQRAKANLPQSRTSNSPRRAELRQQQEHQRARELQATSELLADGAPDHILGDDQVTVLLRLLSTALSTRTIVAGRITGTGGNDSATLRLIPDPHGCRVRTTSGNLILPGLRLEIEANQGRQLR